MNKSEQINELAAALATVQGQLAAVPMNCDNPFFKSKYADLQALWDAIREPMSKAGLSVVQLGEGEGLTTILAHKSGQWIAGTMKVTPVKADPQAYGSALTYSRRYGLAAILGLVGDSDDDGNAGSETDKNPKKQPKGTIEIQEWANTAKTDNIMVKPFPVKEDKPQTSEAVHAPAKKVNGKFTTISEKQAKRLFAIATGAGVSSEALKAYVFATAGVQHSNEIPPDKYEQICNWAQAGGQEAPEETPQQEQEEAPF